MSCPLVLKRSVGRQPFAVILVPVHWEKLFPFVLIINYTLSAQNEFCICIPSEMKIRQKTYYFVAFTLPSSFVSYRSVQNYFNFYRRIKRLKTDDL